MAAWTLFKLFASGALLALVAKVAAFAVELPHGVAGAGRDCSYRSRTHHDVLTFKHCARVDRYGHLHVVGRHLRRLGYDKTGLASIHIDHWYYVRRDGRLAPVMTLDNWAEPFSDGRARSPVGNKVGYIDRGLRLVVPARLMERFRLSERSRWCAWDARSCRTGNIVGTREGRGDASIATEGSRGPSGL